MMAAVQALYKSTEELELLKDIASKTTDLLDFHKDLESLASASMFHLRSLEEDLINGVNILKEELTASESDGPASEAFHENYTGERTTSGKCIRYVLETVKVPRVESKLRVFSSMMKFHTQITEFKKSLNVVESACEEIRTSEKLKGILARILYMGNVMNRGTAWGDAEGFTVDSLLILSETPTANGKTAMHYLCKVIASKAPHLLDFHKELESLETASQIQLKSLAEEMQAITKSLEKLKQEFATSESAAPVAEEVYHKILKDFISVGDSETEILSSLYSVTGNNADALARYFSEDPKCCPFEKVTGTLAKFVRLFNNAHQENVEQAELEKMEAAGEQGLI